jgi:two-component system cell cycle response regulator DivK
MVTTTSRVSEQVGFTNEKNRYLVVVDGNTAELFTAGMILQRLDYTIFTAGSAEECLRIMGTSRPSAVITELLLPKMSGMDLLTRIKMDPRTKDIPVIVHTRMKDPKVEELSLVAGCASFLRKPIDPNTLYRAVQHAIEATPRHYIRLRTCLKVLVGDGANDQTATSECVTALSENGIYIKTSTPHPAQSVLPVTIYLADRKISVRAMVLYRVIGASGPLKEPGMGMKFVEISDADRVFIRNAIKEYLTRDLAV